MTVSEDLHRKVLLRDGMCFYRLKIDPNHQCRDQWGVPHASDDLSKMTVDHFWLHAGGVRGKRAPDLEEYMVAMCARENIRGPSKEVRYAERAYSREIYGE